MTIVIKIGGNALEGSALSVISDDVAELVLGGRRIVVVHGGGPQTSQLQRRLGIEPRQVAGRRITDDAALEAIKMMVGGKLNIDLCAALCRAGIRPVGLHGASSLTLSAVRRSPHVLQGAGPEPVDLGRVGDVTGINRELIELLLGAGFTPVVACIGAAADGSVFNINADVVACRVAVELGAEALALVSDVVGVMRDRADPDSRISRLTRQEAFQTIHSGVVSEGMLPKLEEAFGAIDQGVRRIHIVGQLSRGQLAQELRSPGSVGTALMPS